MAGLWYRTGSVAVTQSSKKITGTGTSWLTALNRPSKGNVFYGPDGKAYEIDYISSETELYLVDAYAGAAATGQSYKIDVRGGTVPELSRQLSEHYAYMQGIIDSLQSIVSGAGDVTITGPSGQTVTLTSLSNMLSKSGNLSGLAAPDTALGNLGLTAVGKAVAKAIDAAAARSALGVVAAAGGSYSGRFEFSRPLGLLGWANTINSDSNNFINRSGLSHVVGNNAVHIFGDDRENARRMGIQAGHASAYYATAFGILELNPYGGEVRVNGNKVYTTGDRPSAADVGAYSKTEMPYESGTFTPVVAGASTAGVGTYALAIGRYTRIGNRVFFDVTLSYSGHTGTGILLVKGLPFVTAANSGYTSLPVTHQKLTTTAALVSAIIGTSSSSFALYGVINGGGWAPLAMDAEADLRFSGSYEI